MSQVYLQNAEQRKISIPVGQATLGRHAGNEIVVDGQGISRQHARFAYQNNQLTVTDLESSNGTYINDQQSTPHKSYRLHNGDEVRFGRFNSFTVYGLDSSPEKPKNKPPYHKPIADDVPASPAPIVHPSPQPSPPLQPQSPSPLIAPVVYHQKESLSIQDLQMALRQGSIKTTLTMADVIGYIILWALIVIFTLGIGFFFVPYTFYILIINSIVIYDNAERKVGKLRCNLSIGQQIGHIVLWIFLTIITMGLAYPFYIFGVIRTVINETEII